MGYTNELSGSLQVTPRDSYASAFISLAATYGIDVSDDPAAQGFSPATLAHLRSETDMGFWFSATSLAVTPSGEVGTLQSARELFEKLAAFAELDGCTLTGTFISTGEEPGDVERITLLDSVITVEELTFA